MQNSNKTSLHFNDITHFDILLFCCQQWETIYEDDFSAPEPDPEPESDDSDFEFDGVRTKKVKSKKREKDKKVSHIEQLSLHGIKMESGLPK